MSTCTVTACSRTVHGHGLCRKHWERNHRYGRTHTIMRAKGTGTIKDTGYHIVKGQRAHRLVVEEILGYPLPDKAVIHHVDENPTNNTPANLVVCANQSHHLLLHKRQRALEACGNANHHRCSKCKTYDSIANLLGPYGLNATNTGYYRHRTANNQCILKP